MAARSAAELERNVLRLDRRQRARIALSLIESLEAPEGTAAEIEAAWSAEADRRDRETADGAVRCVPAAEVFASLRRKRRA